MPLFTTFDGAATGEEMKLPKRNVELLFNVECRDEKEGALLQLAECVPLRGVRRSLKKRLRRRG
jgi:hypothetical protein